MKRWKIIVLISLTAILSSCGVQRNSASFYQTKTVYLNTEGDGSITLRATGQGRNRYDAIAQAYKNAINDVMYTGVEVPGNPFLSKPLLTAVNAREKFVDFTNEFFRDGGEYLDYVSQQDRKILSNRKNRNKIQTKVTVTVRVLRSDLVSYLKESGLINP